MKNLKKIYSLYFFIFFITYGLKFLGANAGAYLGYGAVFLFMFGWPFVFALILIVLILVGGGIANSIINKNWKPAVISLSLFFAALFIPNPLEYAEIMHYKMNRNLYEKEIQFIESQKNIGHGYKSCENLKKTKRIVYNPKIKRYDFYRFTSCRRIIFTTDLSKIDDPDLIVKKEIDKNWYFAEFDFN